MYHFCTEVSQLNGFGIADFRNDNCFWNTSRIGRVDTTHIGPNSDACSFQHFPEYRCAEITTISFKCGGDSGNRRSDISSNNQVRAFYGINETRPVPSCLGFADKLVEFLFGYVPMDCCANRLILTDKKNISCIKKDKG